MDRNQPPEPPEIKYVPFVKMDAPAPLPTITNILTTAHQYGADRLCLVCKGDDVPMTAQCGKCMDSGTRNIAGPTERPEWVKCECVGKTPISREPSLFVFMLSLKAFQVLGGRLAGLMAECPNDPEFASLHMVIDNDSPITMMDKHLRERRQSWRWLELGINKFVVYLHGQAVCEKASRILNRYECPCNLE
jgi:hypothetical protein